MSAMRVVDTDPFFLQRKTTPEPKFPPDLYLRRIKLLLDKMAENNIAHAVFYGDREHFANIEYFTSYDCRFEEGLFILSADGDKTIVVGNEGMGYSYQIPFEVDRVLYQNFSLQGQPRDKSGTLVDVFRNAGVDGGGTVGVVGYKYFYPAYAAAPEKLFDVPMYIMEELFEAAGRDRIVNFTTAITGLPDGVRMRIHDPVEIAWAEHQACKTAGVILNLMDNLREGISEIELSRTGGIDFSPVCMYALVNFGPEHLSLALRSPGERTLALGEVVGLCYGLRGSLTSRTGVAARSLADYPAELRRTFEPFYMRYWQAIAAWYEAVRPGVAGGAVFKAVMDLIGGPEYGVGLNPGHNTGMDEWTNSPVHKDSDLVIGSGSYMQCDVIAVGGEPIRNAICEDTVVVAEEELRDRLGRAFPEVLDRVRARQRKIRDALGIAIDDSLLPMSNLNAAYFPFLMNPGKTFAK